MLISCVMPTRGRREWAALALACFVAQDYPDKELVILDDAEDPSFPEHMPSDDFIQYHREPERNIIEKRNRVNELATGELIAHFDSDDWSDPTRLSRQVAFMQETGKALVGYHTMLFYEPSTQKVARYLGFPDYMCGTSMLYRRDLWESHPFRKPKPVAGADNPYAGSDNGFVAEVRDLKQLAAEPGLDLMVARAHEDNTSPKRMYRMNQQLTLDALPVGFPR